MREAAGKRVCVTGASGYIASWLVKHLLLGGYTVNATVRHPNDPEKTEHLMAMKGAKERLHLYKADLLEEGSFNSAVDGCDGVFHTASPVIFGAKDPQTELLEPALKGTLNVLSSCAKFASVKRVVLTSSIVAVMFTDKLGTPGVVIDETFFSDPNSCEEAMLQGYVMSKTMAEQAAWKFANEKGIEMVTINPAMVLGPLLQAKLNAGVSIILQLINGAKTYQNFAMCWVHIKDVTDAHILAYETPSANGRYILTENVVHHADTVKLLREMYPTLQLPDKCDDDGPLIPTYEISKEKARSLGIKDFVSFEVGLKETIETLKENGFVSF